MLSTIGFDYWESGQDYLPSPDVYQNFVEHQTRLMAEFRRLATQHAFTTVDARGPIPEVFRALCAVIEPGRADMATLESVDGGRPTSSKCCRKGFRARGAASPFGVVCQLLWSARYAGERHRASLFHARRQTEPSGPGRARSTRARRRPTLDCFRAMCSRLTTPSCRLPSRSCRATTRSTSRWAGLP